VNNPDLNSSSMIGKVEKAKRYAQERDRIRFETLSVTFHGENNDHHVSFDGTVWHCDCSFFQSHAMCSHTMALEKVLEQMVPDPARADN